MSVGIRSVSRRVIRLLARPTARWWIVAAVAALLFAGAIASSELLSILTSLPLPTGPVPLTTWLHFFGYAALGAVLGMAFYNGAFECSGVVHSGFLSAFVAAGGYGVLVELLHAFLPHRTFSLFDVAANVAGAFVGCSVLWALTPLLCSRVHTARTERLP